MLHNNNGCSLLVVVLVWTALWLIPTHAQELRGITNHHHHHQQQQHLKQPQYHHHHHHRQLSIWDWFGGDDDDDDNDNKDDQGSFWDTLGDIWNGIFDTNNGNKNSTSTEEGGGSNNSTNSGGGGSIFGDWWNSIFGGGGGDDDDENNNEDPFSSILEDLNNLTDTIFSPIQDAFDAAEDSEEPLLDFLRELLDQPASQEPVRDFIKEAFNRTDTPVLDFLAELFNATTTSAVDDFVRDILDGNTNPLQNFINNIAGEAVFEPKDCSVENAGAPVCAYNWAGDEGVWVCRTLYNTLTGKPMKETICAPPEFTLKDNDVCGSCDGTYPEPCNCDCDLNNGMDQSGAGTYVELGPTTQCVDSKWATGNVGRFELECQEQCA